MAIIPQQTFFVWSEIENLGDLERLNLVLEYMPDEELMRELEKERNQQISNRALEIISQIKLKKM